ncbi:peptidylprolyl isomerase [Acidobacteriota bacterium]
MKRGGLLLFLCFSVFFLGWIGFEQNPYILIQTELGDIELEVYLDKSPITARNFLKYVDEGLFDDGSFYRVVRMDNQPNDDIKIEVIQGGIGQRQGVKRFPPIEHETTETTGVLHKNGVISMARSQPGTASSEFFICINDQPELDFGGLRNPDGQGFASFGIVVRGIDVVRLIQDQPGERQYLETPIRINKIVRIQKKQPFHSEKIYGGPFFGGR